MTTTTLDARVAARRAELTAKRAEQLDELDLPRTMTMRQVNAHVAATAILDQTIAHFEKVVAEYAALPTDAADVAWRDFITTARATISAERLAIKSPIRDRDVKTAAERLEWSIQFIDRGKSIVTIGALVDLSSTRIGELMAAAGYSVTGSALHGPTGWQGSLSEVEQRLKDLARRRTNAQAALDAVLMTDDERAQRDAEAAELRAAANGLRLKGNADGTGLVAFTDDGEVLDPSAMTPLQRKAFERANAAHATR